MSVTSSSDASALAGATDDAPVLSVRDLRVSFRTRRGPAEVVNGVSWDVRAGETLAIVGESGSGKTVSVMSLLGVVPTPPAQITCSAVFEGREPIGMSWSELRSWRGQGLGMGFQDPMKRTNPGQTTRRQTTGERDAPK